MDRDEAIRWLLKVQANVIFGKPCRVYIPREVAPGEIISLSTSVGPTFMGAVTQAKKAYDLRMLKDPPA